MNSEVYQMMMKEWYWIVILGALVAVAFCPSFLKGKCPACGKRTLSSVDVHDGVIKDLLDSGVSRDELPPFTGYFRCAKCSARYKRLRSGPLEEVSSTRFDTIFVR